MSELQIQKYRERLQRSVAVLDAKTPEEREAGYDKLRLAVDALLKKSKLSLGPEVASMLRDSLEEMIQARRGAGRVTPSSQTIADPHAFTRGAFLGLVGAAALGAGLAWTGVLSAFEMTPGSSAVAAAYRANLPRVEIAEIFLERVREEIVGRQAKDPDGLAKVAGARFVPLKALAPELAGELPKALRKTTGVIVRADATGYKILFDWPLCATVQFSKPHLLDPVRKSEVLGCTHFGVWNEAGAEW